MLTLPRRLSHTTTLTPAEFAEVCAANPEAVLELDADGRWMVFDSSGGFQLPDGSVRSPDASVVRLERWRALSEEERDGFAPLCPDLVVELASPSDVPDRASPGCSAIPGAWRRARHSRR